MENDAMGSGMGTAGLVGQINTYATMVSSRGSIVTLLQIALLHFVMPAIIALVISEFMRKKGLIKSGDLKLNI